MNRERGPTAAFPAGQSRVPQVGGKGGPWSSGDADPTQRVMGLAGSPSPVLTAHVGPAGTTCDGGMEHRAQCLRRGRAAASIPEDHSD